ncbi:hypothetical protein RRG08_005034 [Elysia crispata]|uniref:Reverse transcriptase n=1 Tax=Elysia crispata TaxID=231223 RepID=A0AAE1B2T4_9GAST|nr:hypothetical protein RRG08_005034 [Elysia crispata]
MVLGRFDSECAKGGENDGSIGDKSITPENAQRTTRSEQRSNLEMDYQCVCGRRFTTERGMKIHRTKMGCLNASTNQQQRTAQAASAKEQWEALDSKIILQLDKLIGKSTLEHKLTTFGDIIYQTCINTFGAKQHQAKREPKKSRRQREMETLRKQKKNLRKQMKSATEEEKNGLQELWRAAPGEAFNSKPPSLKEINAVVQKARAKSAPGPNGVPYLLYKRCPNVLKRLHKILRGAWSNLKISEQWMFADGVCIPKEQNSTEINQFRPISLLNVEGKIFFSVMASRLTKYLTENGYINTSVQKGGIPGVSG